MCSCITEMCIIVVIIIIIFLNWIYLINMFQEKLINQL